MAPPAGDLLDLLGADLNRRILELTSEEPRAADAVAERCDASLPTVYRHVDDLASAGLLSERTQYDEEGNHYKTYVAALEALTVCVDDGELRVDARTDDGSDPPDSTPIPDGIEKPGSDPTVDDVERPGPGK
ncbi:MAG: ArsR/SmtB family transcription factor [Halolamina sp.]